jgi:hypothetical protein
MVPVVQYRQLRKQHLGFFHGDLTTQHHGPPATAGNSRLLIAFRLHPLEASSSTRPVNKTFYCSAIGWRCPLLSHVAQAGCIDSERAAAAFLTFRKRELSPSPSAEPIS